MVYSLVAATWHFGKWPPSPGRQKSIVHVPKLGENGLKYSLFQRGYSKTPPGDSRYQTRHASVASNYAATASSNNCNTPRRRVCNRFRHMRQEAAGRDRAPTATDRGPGVLTLTQ